MDGSLTGSRETVSRRQEDDRPADNDGVVVKIGGQFKSVTFIG